MKYNFDEPTSRYGMDSIKWEQYNDPDIIALSNADMDFDSAPCIKEALVKCAERGWYGYTLKTDSYYQSIIASVYKGILHKTTKNGLPTY